MEDLFYNVPTRRKALKNASEEYQKIVDIVSKLVTQTAAYMCEFSGRPATMMASVLQMLLSCESIPSTPLNGSLRNFNT